MPLDGVPWGLQLQAFLFVSFNIHNSLLIVSVVVGWLNPIHHY